MASCFEYAMSIHPSPRQIETGYIARTLKNCRQVRVESSKNSVLLKNKTQVRQHFLESPSNLGKMLSFDPWY